MTQLLSKKSEIVFRFPAKQDSLYSKLQPTVRFLCQIEGEKKKDTPDGTKWNLCRDEPIHSTIQGRPECRITHLQAPFPGYFVAIVSIYSVVCCLVETSLQCNTCLAFYCQVRFSPPFTIEALETSRTHVNASIGHLSI